MRADRLLLYQALSNLVTNAIKYSPSGTTVTIGVTNGNGAVRFQIADQGFGIPADEWDNLKAILEENPALTQPGSCARASSTVSFLVFLLRFGAIRNWMRVGAVRAYTVWRDARQPCE